MKQIIVNREHLQTRIALTEDGKIQEYYTETGSNKRLVGSIFKGRVTNLEDSLQAAFVDLGLGKNAFLHYWDMIPATKNIWEEDEDSDYDEEEADGKGASKSSKNVKAGSAGGNLAERVMKLFTPSKRSSSDGEKTVPRRRPKQRRNSAEEKSSKEVRVEDIPTRFAVNSEVVVQVTKGAIGTKGPRVTTNLSIPGRYVVLLPGSDHRGVSKRIEDRKERSRLREVIRQLELPRRMGLICRTASIGLDEKALQLDIDILVEKWKESQQLSRNNKAPICIHEEPDLLDKVVRDLLTDDVESIIVDSKKSYSHILSQIKRLDRKDRSRVKYNDNPKPIFEHYKLTDQIKEIYKRKISLSSGAELCIDETEALIAIDINSKKSRKGKDHPETILNTNLEAAEEIGRQLRLRNIGGLVIIDFIDMRSRKDRSDVYQKMKEVLAADRAKTKIIPISKLGLLEMTRQREYESLQDATYESCEYCKGTGLIKSSITISVELQRRLQEILRSNRGKTPIRVTVHPSVLTRLKKEDADILEIMEDEFGGELSFRADPKLHQEEFRFVNTTTGKEI